LPFPDLVSSRKLLLSVNFRSARKELPLNCPERRFVSIGTNVSGFLESRGDIRLPPPLLQIRVAKKYNFYKFKSKV
jgi:hypothetical protein